MKSSTTLLTTARSMARFSSCSLPVSWLRDMTPYHHHHDHHHKVTSFRDQPCERPGLLLVAVSSHTEVSELVGQPLYLGAQLHHLGFLPPMEVVSYL